VFLSRKSYMYKCI